MIAQYYALHSLQFDVLPNYNKWIILWHLLMYHKLYDYKSDPKWNILQITVCRVSNHHVQGSYFVKKKINDFLAVYLQFTGVNIHKKREKKMQWGKIVFVTSKCDSVLSSCLIRNLEQNIDLCVICVLLLRAIDILLSVKKLMWYNLNFLAFNKSIPHQFTESIYLLLSGVLEPTNLNLNMC